MTVPDLPLARRVIAAAEERGYAMRRFHVLLTMALLRAGEWHELERTVAGLEPQFAQANPGGRLWFDWVQRLTAAITTPTKVNADNLVEIMNRHVFSLQAERLTVSALRQAGRKSLAQDAEGIARKFYPGSPEFRMQPAETENLLQPETEPSGHHYGVPENPTLDLSDGG